MAKILPIHEIALPELFQHYTLSLKRAGGHLTVTVLGSISEIDQSKLIGYGWTKLSNSIFTIPE